MRTGRKVISRAARGGLPGWAACLLMLASAGAAEEPYDWPLGLPRVLTSSFGEYRAGRFHAGIDLRTGGIGKPVHTPLDGYVSRVRCSPSGYGKAVYLKLADGCTVVFGHLDDYSPALRDYVRRAQHEDRSYTVDLTPPANAFPVKRGDVVAYSGQTGIGAPHLHYEIRDEQEALINPRLLGITWPDNTRPVVRKVLVAPQGPGSTVNGGIVPVILDAREAAPGRYTCSPVRVSGTFGLAVDALDPANEGANRLGVYQVRTVLDGREAFLMKMDRFTYDDRQNLAVSYHPFFLDEGWFMLQWRWPGNVCDPYQQTASTGWIAAPGQPVEARLEISDFTGNDAVVTVPIEPDSPAAPVEVARAGNEPGSVTLECMGEWLIVTAWFPNAESDAPVLSVEGADGAQERAMARVSPTLFRVGVRPSPDAQALEIRAAHPRLGDEAQRVAVFHRGAARRTLESDRVRVQVGPNSPYGVLFLEVQAESAADAPPIPLRSTPVRLWPEASPVDQAVTLSFPMPDGIEQPRRAGIYRRSGADWRYVGSKHTGDRLETTTGSWGVYAVLEDDAPPTLRLTAPAADAPAASLRPAIEAEARDIGSGIADITATCNGQWLLMAYDPEHSRVEWEADEDLEAGENELVITATDEAGNVTTVRRSFVAAPGGAPAQSR